MHLFRNIKGTLLYTIYLLSEAVVLHPDPKWSINGKSKS